MEKLPFDFTKAVSERYSMRTFNSNPVEEKTRRQILDFAENITNPFGPKIRIKFIEKNTDSKGEKLGTYGIIKNASLFLGVAVKKDDFAMEALGYEFEELILYITSLGLGSCWIGGTFDKTSFSQIMAPEKNEIFSIISPVGYGGKKRLFEKVMRANLKADSRLSWDKLFFTENFSNPLKKDFNAEYAYVLEMLRQAPSAVNKQPWRVVYKDKAFHFFENHSMPVSEDFDIQRVDMGIALCHFDFAAREKNLKGHFEKVQIEINLPQNTEYITSWICEE